MKLSPAQGEALVKVFETALRTAVLRTDLCRTCLECAHFVNDKCTFNGANVTPPPRIIVEACNNYDDIPF